MSLAVVLSEPFSSPESPAGHPGAAPPRLGELTLEAYAVDTAAGQIPCFRYPGPQEAYVLFRRGWPDVLPPHHVPYRAQALALQALGVRAALFVGQVLVLDDRLPLSTPLQIGDLLMPDNRLPDGTVCTLADAPQAAQAQRSRSADLISTALNEQISMLGDAVGAEPCPPAVLAYGGVPRQPTRAEELFWLRMGAELHGGAMGPDLVLAHELGISCAALAVGTSYARSQVETEDAELDRAAMHAQTRRALDPLLVVFLAQGRPIDR